MTREDRAAKLSVQALNDLYHACARMAELLTELAPDHADNESVAVILKHVHKAGGVILELMGYSTLRPADQKD